MADFTLPRWALPAALLLAALLLAAAGRLAPATDENEPADDAPAPRRVVVHVDRHTDIAGYVEEENEYVIVVRDRQEKLHSFSKSQVVAIIRLVDPEPDQPGLIVLRNGELREGIIIEDAFDYVLIEIEGVRAKLKRSVVDHVRLEPTVQQRYERYKATLKPDMADRHLELCRWLFRQKRYELAEKELTELLANHDLPEAHRLQRIVQAQLALAQKPTRPAGEDDATAGDRTPQDDDDDEGRPRPEDLLTEDDVNLIRVYELSFRHPPKVAISRQTIDQLIQRYAEDPLMPASQAQRQALYRAEPLQIVELMFNLRARDLYGEIKVLSEPQALNLFRQRVHNTWLMNTCATSRCHGGPHGAGRLKLYRHRHKDARVRYTNFLILQRLELDEDWPLINYDQPLDSLIIQHGLPRDQARHPHPEVDGWRPAFRRASDRLVRDAVEWIEAMFTPRPDYPVVYEPPRVGSDAAGGEEEAPPSPEPEGGRTGR